MICHVETGCILPHELAEPQKQIYSIFLDTSTPLFGMLLGLQPPARLQLPLHRGTGFASVRGSQDESHDDGGRRRYGTNDGAD